MYYASLENGEWVRCNVADKAPGVVFASEPTEEELKQYGVIIVHDSPSLPPHDPATQGLADIQPTQGADGKWYANYIVVDIPPQTEQPPLPGSQMP